MRQMVEYREQVGARIRQLRQARGLTQDELADMIGVQEKTVSRWESGRHSGYQRNLKALAAALEVPPEEITGTPPAPLGLGARAEQIDDGFVEFRQHVTNLEGRLDRIERAVADLTEAVREQRIDNERALADQTAILEIIKGILGAGLTQPGEDDGPARIVQAVSDAAARAGALPEPASRESEPHRAQR